MYIKSLQLKNYRNYESLDISFDRGTNILYGDNAQGKTNILEAIYLSATTKSHKGSKDKEIIAFEKAESHIRTFVNKKSEDFKVDIHLKKNKTKGIAINGIPIKKAKELFGILNIVFFSPEDLNIIKNGPSERRRFIDLELCQLNKLYLIEIANYNRVLNHRNKLLKDIAFNQNLLLTLDIWDEQLASYGKKIISMREDFINSINSIIFDIHKDLTGRQEELHLIYEKSVKEDNFLEELKKSRDKDLKYRMTSIGPHRDDLGVFINKIDVRKYGSQGQQRTVALSLKLSEIYLVEKLIHDKPVLLLDDVLSELDKNRQNYLLNSIKDIQTIITCTGLDDFVTNRFQINKLFQVVKGNVFHSN